MMLIRVVAVLAGVGFTIARGADRTPGTVQDPPGRVFVDQPAGVSFTDRDTPRDTTDPMHGPPYADLRAPGITPSAHPSPPPRAEGQQPRAQGAPAQATPRAERRPANEGSTSSSTGTPPDPSTGNASDTALGTDIGHGAGTEQPVKR